MRRMLDTIPVDTVTLETRDEPAAALDIAERPVQWRLATRVVFRLSFVYFSLYVLTTQMLGGLLILPVGNLPNLGATGLLSGIVSWTATHLFRATSFVTTNTGSGDKTIDWVHAFVLLVLAAVATAVWSVVDRQRANYAAMNKWFRVFLRFAVGATMVSYGMAKAIPLQMPAPSLQRLVEPFGNFSPMGVIWYSIGASFAYERFAGCMELLGAVLLFVPRLALLGALVTLATSIQIFTLNMTYDVPVKLFSFHLILMSLVLIAPEMSRLVRVIILDKATAPSSQPALLRGVRGRRVLLAVQLAAGAYIVGINVYGANQSWTRFGGGAPKSPLYGIWNVDEMRVDGVVRSPLVNDYGRWRRVIFQNPAAMSFQRMDDSFQGYAAKVDMDAKTLALTSGDKNWGAKFTIDRPANDRLVLDGDMDGHKVRLDMRLVDRNKFLLVSRGFNWVQERPFNR